MFNSSLSFSDFLQQDKEELNNHIPIIDGSSPKSQKQKQNLPDLSVFTSLAEYQIEKNLLNKVLFESNRNIDQETQITECDKST